MSINQMFYRIVGILSIVLAVSNCGGGGEQPDTPPTPQRVEVTSISLSQTSVEMFVGDVLLLSASVVPQNATEKTISWSSDRSDIATVDNQGKVTAISPGSAMVKAFAGGVSSACQITVIAKTVSVTSVTVSPETLSLTEGETASLKATVQPENADNKAVKWSSSDETIASVDDNGNVTANGVGTADITVTTDDGGKQAICVVIVQKSIVHVTGVKLSQTSAYMFAGEALQLMASVLPDTADNINLSWNSSDNAVATVDSIGKVSAFKAGTTVISVITEDGGYTATCSIAITDTINGGHEGTGEEEW